MTSDEIEVQHFARGKPVLIWWHANFIVRAGGGMAMNNSSFKFTSG